MHGTGSKLIDVNIKTPIDFNGLSLGPLFPVRSHLLGNQGMIYISVEQTQCVLGLLQYQGTEVPRETAIPSMLYSIVRPQQQRQGEVHLQTVLMLLLFHPTRKKTCQKQVQAQSRFASLLGQVFTGMAKLLRQNSL